MEAPRTPYVHAGRKAPCPARGGARGKRETVGPGRGLEEASPAPGRTSPRLPGVAARSITPRAPAHGKETGATCQAIVVAKAPRGLGIGVAVAPVDGLALQRLGFVPKTVRPQRPFRRPCVCGPPRPPRATRTATAVTENPIGLRENTKRGHGLPISGRVVKTLPAREVP